MSARKPASFWREKRDAVVILVRVFAKIVESKQVNNTVAVFPFFGEQKGSVTSNKKNWATYTANKE